jgi:hypothetical protein
MGTNSRAFSKTNSRAFSKWMWIGAASVMFGIGGRVLAFDGITAVPELDPGTSASGLALLIGGALLLLERSRRS